jgi:hypothetical protein
MGLFELGMRDGICNDVELPRDVNDFKVNVMLNKDVNGGFENDAVDVNGVGIIRVDGQMPDEGVRGSSPVEGRADSQGFKEEDMV